MVKIASQAAHLAEHRGEGALVAELVFDLEVKTALASIPSKGQVRRAEGICGHAAPFLGIVINLVTSFPKALLQVSLILSLQQK